MYATIAISGQAAYVTAVHVPRTTTPLMGLTPRYRGEAEPRQAVLGGGARSRQAVAMAVVVDRSAGTHGAEILVEVLAEDASQAPAVAPATMTSRRYLLPPPQCCQSIGCSGSSPGRISSRRCGGGSLQISPTALSWFGTCLHHTTRKQALSRFRIPSMPATLVAAGVRCPACSPTSTLYCMCNLDEGTRSDETSSSK